MKLECFILRVPSCLVPNITAHAHASRCWPLTRYSSGALASIFRFSGLLIETVFLLCEGAFADGVILAWARDGDETHPPPLAPTVSSTAATIQYRLHDACSVPLFRYLKGKDSEERRLELERLGVFAQSRVCTHIPSHTYGAPLLRSGRRDGIWEGRAFGLELGFARWHNIFHAPLSSC